jgi:iron complex transport system permease protein
VRIRWRITPGVRLALLAALAVAAVAVFVFAGIEGSWDFAVPFRFRKVSAMLVVAAAVGISTVLFQTITANRILSPGVMGFDALYLAIQTVVVFAFGAVTLATADPQLMWLVEVLLMVGASLALFRFLFARSARSIHVLILVGIVFGVLFRSVTSLLQRMLDPADFAVVQDASFASFTAVDEQLVLLSAIAVAVCAAVAWSIRRRLDVLVLGEATATALGVDHRRMTTLVLVLVAVLVSVSTALVGPITFFGLLVANLAYAAVGTFRHSLTLPAAVLLGVAALAGGQFVLEAAGLDTVLAVVIEFLGGLVFIALLIGKGVR